MHSFDTVAQVQEVLDALAERDDPLVARLERQPGRKESRYGQLLLDAEQTNAGPLAEQANAGPAWGQRPPSDQSAPPDGQTLIGLAREVELLRVEVAELRTQVEGLREGTEGG
jgi:uncharacterized protein YceH (UPF0502 family)